MSQWNFGVERDVKLTLELEFRQYIKLSIYYQNKIFIGLDKAKKFFLFRLGKHSRKSKALYSAEY